MKVIVRASILLCLLSFPLPLVGQSALVRYATAETYDGLIFRVWVTKQKIKSGQDVELRFQIENRSSKALYLVLANPIEAEMIDGYRLLVVAPYVFDEHAARNNEFQIVEIKGGAKYEGKFVIPGNTYRGDRVYPIDVGFSYVRDITGFERRINDPVNKTALSRNIEYVYVGGLTVDVEAA